MDAQVLIQAGHEGKKRNKGNGTTTSVGATGIALPEHKMTPIVADRATEVLRAHGVSVVRVPGVYPRVFHVDLGICLHFDGSTSPCGSGASVGYPAGVPAGSNKPTAQLWKSIWGEVWPFGFEDDNFTEDLRGYYGYSRMSTNIAELLIEFGEISCPQQDAWLQANLHLLGDMVAYFAGRVLGVDIPKPTGFVDPAAVGGGGGAGGGGGGGGAVGGPNPALAPAPMDAGDGAVAGPAGDGVDAEVRYLREELAVLRAALADLAPTASEPAGFEFDADLSHT